ncbi:MAG: DUF4070 domain-containing protein, partial [Planctomycetaceae bacterium]|nr:DUF4070 domain-containing protein [Planctomycetaceae bacterium]
GRLIDGNHQLVPANSPSYRLQVDHDCEHSTGGLNFVTTRDRIEVYESFGKVIREVYSPQNYMDRVLSTAGRLKLKRKHLGSWFELKRMVRGFFNIAIGMTRNPATRRLYWRNTFRTALMGFAKFEYAQSMMSLYLHFGPQTDFIRQQLDISIQYTREGTPYPRQVVRKEAS